MKGRERHERSELVEHLRCDDCGTGKTGSAVYHAVADAEHVRAAVRRAQPAGERIERTSTVAHHRFVERFVVHGGQTFAGAILRGEPR